MIQTAPIPALDVNEREPAMSLARLRIKIPVGFVFRNCYGHLGNRTITEPLCDVHSHLSGVEAFRWLCQLDFGMQPINILSWFNEFHLESHLKTAVNVLHREKLHIEHRERSPLHRLGDVFIPHLRKPVIRADEEIVPGDVSPAVERWPVRRNFPCVLVPLQLHSVRLFPPRSQCPSVDISRPHLLRSPLEPALQLASPIAPAVPMIERHIAYR